MKKNNSETEQAQGAKSVDLAQVTKWLRHDISVAITCLNAIQSDPDLMDHVARFMYGRLQNMEQAKQPNLFKQDNSHK